MGVIKRDASGLDHSSSEERLARNRDNHWDDYGALYKDYSKGSIPYTLSSMLFADPMVPSID